VFSTLKGGRPSPNNIRSRVLKVAVERANKNLAKRKLAPLPERITPHSLRRTFASVLYALGEDPGIVMDEMGHTKPRARAARLPPVDASRRGREDAAPDHHRGRPNGRYRQTSFPDAFGGHRASRRGRPKPNRIGLSGHVAQWESARFTRERSVVRNHPCPLRKDLQMSGLCRRIIGRSGARV
jgi:hypothetical protein